MQTVHPGGAGFPTPAQQSASAFVYADALEFHRARIKMLLESALGGHIPFCPGVLNGKFEPKMEAGDIWEAITGDVVSDQAARAAGR